MATVSALLQVLPPFEGRYDVIAEKQTIGDIVREVLAAHQEFAPDYDLIAKFFMTRDMRTVEELLFDFCKKNLFYKEETDKMQSTRPPSGILAMGSMRNNFLDCKHFAGFIAGILDAINRNGWRSFNWCYRFAGYQWGKKETNHVFVVVKYSDGEVWIDPTPINPSGKNIQRDFDDRYIEPYYILDKKTRAMTLVRMHGIGGGSGFTATNVVKRTDLKKCGNIKVSIPASKMGTIFNSYYLDQYYIPFAQRVMVQLPDWVAEAAVHPPVQFYDAAGAVLPLPLPWVLGGPAPPVPAGLQVFYADSFMGTSIPYNLPKPVCVDGKLQWSPFDIPGFPGQATNALLTANHNRLLYIMMSAMGALVQSYSNWPYGQDASGLATLGHYILDLRNKDDFRKAVDTKTALGYFIEAAGNTLTAVEEGVMKFIGSPCRNAFLLLVQNNIFGVADGLNSQKGSSLQSQWEHLGGTYSNLTGAIDTGHGKHAILGIGCAACDHNTIGCIDGVSTAICAAIAVAAPILVILAGFLKNVSPNASKAVTDAKTNLDALEKLAGGDPQKLADLLNKPVTVTSPTGVVTTVKPASSSSGLMQFIQANPVEAGAIGLGAGVGLYYLLTSNSKHGKRKK